MAIETDKHPGRDGGRSEMDPVVSKPGSKADPSTAPDWEGHVQDYFNQDATPGEALPTATHEAKEAPPAVPPASPRRQP